MRWLRLIKRYSLPQRPTLKVINPRIGTSIIPLGHDDGEIFFQYLTDKMHALTFTGSEVQLLQMVEKLQFDRKFTIQKMRTSAGRGREKLVLLHLKFSNNSEIRRLIKLT